MNRRLVNAVLIGLVLAATAGHSLALYNMPFEDSYITFRYARNLADGHGLVYNPGERVEGFTSFGWTVLLAGVHATGLDMPMAACGLSLLFGLLLVLLTAQLAQRWLSLDKPWWLAPPLLLAAHGTFAYYTLTGMETSLFALLVTLGVFEATSDNRKAWFLAGAYLGLSALVRPEGVGYFGLIGLALLLQKETRARVLPVAGLFLAIFVPYFVWRWQHFGFLLPNTYYAKATPSGVRFLMGTKHFEQFFTLHLFWLAPIGAALALSRKRWKPWALMCLILLAGAVINVIFVGGDTFSFYRFFLPVIPIGAVATVAGMFHSFEAVGRRLGGRGRTAHIPAAAMLAALTLFVFCAASFPRVTLSGDGGKSNLETVRDVQRINDDYFRVGRTLGERLGPDATIAVNAAGIVPYESGLPTIDMLGLNDVHIAHVWVPPGQGSVGHEKHDMEYVLGRRPDIIIPGLPVLSRRKITQETVGPWFARWFPYLPGDKQLFSHPEFPKLYRAFDMKVDDSWLCVFLRRDAPVPSQ